MRTTIISATLLALAACERAPKSQVCVPVLPGWATVKTGKPVGVVGNAVTLKGRQITWNGRPIDQTTLDEYLREVTNMNPRPFMIFDPGAAPDCAFASRVQGEISEALPCRQGACWRGSKADYDRAPFRKPSGDVVP
jgi:hypothetical protein